MESEKKIKVTISNTIGTVMRAASLPSEVPVGQLLPALVVRLNLSLVDGQRRQIKYRLYHDGNELGQDVTLERAGVRDGANLVLSQEGEAGFSIPDVHSTREISDELSHPEA